MQALVYILGMGSTRAWSFISRMLNMWNNFIAGVWLIHALEESRVLDIMFDALLWCLGQRV